MLTHDNDDGLAWAGVAADTESNGDPHCLEVLIAANKQIKNELGCTELLLAGPFDDPGIFVTTEAYFGDSDEKQEKTRQWMFDFLVGLRSAIEARLGAVVDELPKPLTELITAAPWREAVTYRETWPHEYVLLQKDGQWELLKAVCERFRNGEGVPSRFFAMDNVYLFVGDHKYWLMTHYDEVGWDDEVVLNRARLYRDRRDFIIQDGDTGRREDYPVGPPHIPLSP